MNTVTVYFTTKLRNPFSWFIRWLVPRTRFALSRASHAMVVVDDYVWEAQMLGGVRKIPKWEALASSSIIEVRNFYVSDFNRGIEFGESQLGKPYDWKAAAGLALGPDRYWQRDDAWDCVEFVAAWLEACGRKTFRETGRVTIEMLMSIEE